MRYLSVCSGIEAASVAWHPLGWQPVAVSEIEPFPSAVLAHHWPEIPNLGDMTRFHEWPNDLAPDLIVGGTPCQAFSVAGLRRGLADPRGNLTLTFLAILARYRPRWVVWENVPGVLSDKTGAFGSFIGGLAKLGYGWSYRVLDAQYFGVPQRRRRVFVVGHLGDWARAAAVFFERHSMQGHPPPSRSARQKVTGTLTSSSLDGSGTDGGDGRVSFLVAGTLQANGKAAGSATQQDAESGLLVAYGGGNTQGHLDTVPTLNANRGCHNPGDFEAGTLILSQIAGTICKDSFSGGCGGRPEGAAAGHFIPDPLAFSCKDHGADAGHLAPTLRSMSHAETHANGGGQIAIAFSGRARGDDGRGYDRPPHVFGSEAVGALDTVKPHCIAFPAQMSGTQVAASEDLSPNLQAKNPTAVATFLAAVRRLTPRECERLQGFPDDHTLIPWRGKPVDSCPDGPRYKALGNSMAVPVMRWIGARIAQVDTMSPTV